ncbi:MAG: immunoglobulin domain-containing protein, partial [Verrucomicrobia bacterium]|nr:immunoglobulin domain-containing protein [Verrucomicrobiota bacterium]
PSWNNQFGDIKKPGWLAVHRLDGSIASGNSAVKLDFTEADELGIGSDGSVFPYTSWLYDAWVEVVPDTTAPANLDKSEVLVTFGTAGFGVFTVQNVGATLVASPSNQTVAAGTEATLVANVTGSPNAFQWYKDGQALPADPAYQGTTRKATLKIAVATGKDAGVYQLRWTNPVSGAGQTAEATLNVTAEATRLTAVQIQPEVLPIVIPAGSVTATGDDTFTVSGPGLKAWTSPTDTDQPGDVQEFAYESVTGDFDKIVKVTGLTSGPVTDPVDNQASAGLQARVDTNALSASFLINISNPLGDPAAGGNQLTVRGRAIAGQAYTSYGATLPGVADVLPNQWLRLRRVGDYFAAYVSTNGLDWALVGQRYQQWPATLLVGTYAFSASYTVVEGVGSGGENLATALFSNYGNAVVSDSTPPALVSVGTTDKKVVGVKFSEPVNSASAVLPINYKLSEGTVASVRMGIGGDSVYLTVNGLTADTFTVTVLGGVTDTSGNPIAANSSAVGKNSNWSSADVGLIQTPEARPTPGDDPYRTGLAVAVSSEETETEVEIIGGGSNAWNAGDYIHYLSRPVPLTGNFDVMVELSRNDRPANTAGWANSGLMFRESVYLPGQEYTPDGTKVPMVANTTYIEASAPNRAGIPLWREEAGGGYGNGNAGFAWTTPINGIKGYYLGQRAINAAGTPDPESSPLSSRWLRVVREGNGFMFYVSYDGKEWAALDEAPKELPLGNQLLFGFSSMNDTGSAAPPGNAYPNNGELGTPLEGNQNASNYSVQRIRIGTNVTPRGDTPTINIQSGDPVQIIFTGTLQSADTLGGAYTAVPGASSPYTVPAGTSQKFYRASN